MKTVLQIIVGGCILGVFTGVLLGAAAAPSPDFAFMFWAVMGIGAALVIKFLTWLSSN